MSHLWSSNPEQEGITVPKKGPFDKLYEMPGHLIRRCHQISVGIFHDVCSEFDMTPIQFALMWGIRSNPGVDQVQLSRLIGVDRTTISNVILRLEKRGALKRSADATDRRVKRLALTPSGEKLLMRALPSVQKVQDQFLAPLDEDERTELIRLLTKAVSLNNENSRAPTAPKISK